MHCGTPFDDLRRNQDSTPSKELNINKSRGSCQICYKEGQSASICRKLTNFGPEILVCQIYKKRG